VNDTQDAWGLFESRIEHYPILEPEEQLELFEEYDNDRTGVRGKEAFEALCGSNWRLSKKVIADILASRDRSISAEEYGELASEANVAMCEAIESFDPSRGGSLSSYIASLVERRVRLVLAGDLPASWSKVRRIASGVEQNLTADLGRVPSEAELIEGVQEYCLGWAKERLIEAGEPGDVEAARAKLVRQGTWAATQKLGEIRSFGRSLSLDKTTDDGLSLLDTLGDGDPGEVVDVLSWFLASLEADDRELITRRYGLDGEREARLEELGEEQGVAWPVIRTRIAGLLGRIFAPHAQYASLSEIDDQIIDADEVTSVSDRLKSRRGLSQKA
jgi:hypothetical protein